MTISAVLKKHGHATELVMGSSSEKVANETLKIDPDIAAFSTLTATGDFEWALEIARHLKEHKPEIVTVFGGMHPTLFPEETMENAAVDILCRGEGEKPMLEVCDRFSSHEDLFGIPGIWIKRAGRISKNPPAELVKNIDEFPFPDRDLYQKYKYFDNLNSIDVIASRGCPFDCNYCYAPTLRKLYGESGNIVRKHSVDYVIAELESLKQKYKPRSFTFVDELFPLDKKWLADFSRKYAEKINLPFVLNMRADTVDTETVSLLKTVGLSRVCLGLETGNEKLRLHLLNKRITNEQFEKSAKVLHDNKIKFLTTNMLGLPGETVENAFETIRFNRQIKTDFVYFSIFQPYPKLELTRRIERAGAIPVLKPSEYDTTYFKGSLLRQDNIRQLVNLHKLFYLAFKLPWLEKGFKKLIKLPPNRLFDYIFILSFGWLQLSCFRRNPLQLLAMGLGNLKVFYGRGLS